MILNIYCYIIFHDIRNDDTYLEALTLVTVKEALPSASTGCEATLVDSLKEKKIHIFKNT